MKISIGKKIEVATFDDIDKFVVIYIYVTPVEFSEKTKLTEFAHKSQYICYKYLVDEGFVSEEDAKNWKCSVEAVIQ